MLSDYLSSTPYKELNELGSLPLFFPVRKTNSEKLKKMTELNMICINNNGKQQFKSAYIKE